MKILVTAFDPFGGEMVNPAALAVAELPAEIAGAEILTAIVPTAFGVAGQTALQHIIAQQPDAVVCVGQAGGRAELTSERVAINLRDARIADNLGAQPLDEPVVANAPAAYFATLPIKAMIKHAREAGVLAALSNSAGTFVCNDIMYTVLHWAAVNAPHMRAGFVHVPYLPEQTVGKSGEPAMPLAQMVAGLTAMLEAVVTYKTDIHTVEGAIS